MTNTKLSQMRCMAFHLLYLFFFFLTWPSQNIQAQTAVSRPNIVWLVSEDNSQHWLQLYQKNGVAMPSVEALAQHGLVFDHAFSQAPVCSVARSTLISGSYAPRIGAQYHRKSEPVPMPDGLKMFPYYLRQAGYYTSNNA
ncbi:MAG: sulfatase-like hydrolase/transferase, partial [Lewinella sp.]|nr:sulfatase-like hydrolase/transferase [Lewinella sp.]